MPLANPIVARLKEKKPGWAAPDHCGLLLVTNWPASEDCRTKYSEMRSALAAALPDCSAARPNFPAALAPPTVAPPRDGIYNLIMITLFRIAFARALGQQSSAPWFPAASSYDGLVDMARKLYVALPGTDAWMVIGPLT